MHNSLAIRSRASRALADSGVATVRSISVLPARRLTRRNCLRLSLAWAEEEGEGETADPEKDPICKCTSG